MSNQSDSDFITEAKQILTIEPDQVLENFSIVVKNGQIVDLASQEEAKQRYPKITNIQNRHKHAIMPGFVNAHTHIGMTLLRGFADDKDLHTQLSYWVQPAESHFIHEEFTRDGTELGLAEMILSGTTLFNEMYQLSGIAAEQVKKSGLRALLSLAFINFSTKVAENFDDHLRQNRKVLEDQKDACPSHIRFSLDPHAPYTVCDTNLKTIKDLASKYNLPIHTHLHETFEEVENSQLGNRQSQACHLSDEKCSPIKNFLRLGLLNSNLIAAHVVHVDKEEIDLLSKNGVSVVHCPVSNMKLAAGFSPVAEMVDAGVNVALGTDSTGSNNTLNMLGEIKIAALVGKTVAKDATKLDAVQVLRMATLNGAKALGFEKLTGSLEIGKRADFIAIEICDNLVLQPVFCIKSHIVYCAGRESITDLWVDGKQLLLDRRLMTINQAELMIKTAKWQERISQYRHELMKRQEN